ncbi:MAG: lipoate--protein ligase family protein [Elusimicrobia bacterium]|nr:lipoate--protein ligase family protein [Elusimicrobiota bacterium]
MNNGLIIKTTEMDVYENMSCDEVLCETMPEKYILRFFNWAKDGITFGLSQRFNNVLMELDAEDKNIDITRRPTGGGVVIHKTDITFSFIFYSPTEFNPLKTYEQLHTAILDEYLKNGITLELMKEKTKSYDINSSIISCFKKPVEKDIMSGGKKVLGGAIRKFSDYILYQSSLQIEGARNESELHKGIITSAFKKSFDLEFEKFELTNEYYKKIESKKVEKYQNSLWIKRI